MNEEIQKKYLELQLINQNFQQIKEQLTILSQQIVQLQSTSDSLDALGDVKGKNEILVPLGGGLFAKADFDKGENVLANVGADVLVERDLQDGKGLVKQQIDELADIISELEINLQHLSVEAQKIQEEIEKSGQEGSK